MKPMLKKLMQKFYRVSVFLFLALFTFVNDYSVGPIYLFFILYLLLITIRLIENLKYTWPELCLQFFLLLLFSYHIIYELDSNNSYSSAIAMTILFVNSAPLFFKIYNWIEQGERVFFQLSSLVFITAIVYFFIYGNRIEILFGRNVLYRIFAFLYAFGFLTIVNKKIIVQFFYFIIFTLAMLSLGSRGGLVVAIFFSLLLMLRLNDSSISLKFFPILSLLVILGSGYLILQDVFRRVFYFNLENASEVVRINYFQNLLELFQSFDFFEIIFGIGSKNYYMLFAGYPHNFFIEYIIFYGTLVAFTALFIYILLFKNYKNLYLYPFYGIAIGSFFSGDLYYNFTIFMIPLFLFWNKNEILIRR